LLQLPFFRVLIQGRIGVAIFCLVTGYVCSLKPIKFFLQGNQRDAYESMNKSAIRRVPRLVLPVVMVITLSGIATQLGAFEVANHCDGYGLPATSPNRRGSISSAIYAMVHDIINVWARGHSEYGAELWTMMPILKGAFWVYAFLLATAHVQQKWRMAIALGLTLFRWSSNDPFFGMQFFFGAFMADLQNLEPGTFTQAQCLSSRRLRNVMSVFFLIVGLFIASLPDDHLEWQPWSLGLRNFLAAILPAHPDFPRFSSGFGLDVIVIGLHLSPRARNILSNRFFLWLGRMSFAVYVLHNQILRSVLCWMIYGFRIPDEKEKTLTLNNREILVVYLPIYLALTYGSAHLWTRYVDSWCARASERMVAFIKEENEGASLPLTNPPRLNFN
jgi:peptidoglycan/LPS O-acetylase OafA/YrhL